LGLKLFVGIFRPDLIINEGRTGTFCVESEMLKANKAALQTKHELYPFLCVFLDLNCVLSEAKPKF